MTTPNTGSYESYTLINAMRNAYINQYSSKQNTVGKIGICMLNIVNVKNVEGKQKTTNIFVQP